VQVGVEALALFIIGDTEADGGVDDHCSHP
jgi:hypothetical protein